MRVTFERRAPLLEEKAQHVRHCVTTCDVRQVRALLKENEALRREARKQAKAAAHASEARDRTTKQLGTALEKAAALGHGVHALESARLQLAAESLRIAAAVAAAEAAAAAAGAKFEIPPLSAAVASLASASPN